MNVAVYSDEGKAWRRRDWYWSLGLERMWSWRGRLGAYGLWKRSEQRQEGASFVLLAVRNEAAEGEGLRDFQ